MTRPAKEESAGNVGIRLAPTQPQPACHFESILLGAFEMAVGNALMSCHS